MGAEVDSVSEFEDILCLDPSLSIKRSQDLGNTEPPAKVPEPATS